MKPYRQFKGIKLDQNMNKRSIFLLQKIYLEKVLKHTNISNYKLVYCPIIFVINFQKNLEDLASKKFICLYQSHVGTYIWAYMYTCPNLGFTVFIQSCFFSNLIPKHMAAMQRIYQYLQATKNMKIVYYDSFIKYLCLEIYKDID